MDPKNLTWKFNFNIIINKSDGIQVTNGFFFLHSNPSEKQKPWSRLSVGPETNSPYLPPVFRQYPAPSLSFDLIQHFFKHFGADQQLPAVLAPEPELIPIAIASISRGQENKERLPEYSKLHPATQPSLRSDHGTVRPRASSALARSTRFTSNSRVLKITSLPPFLNQPSPLAIAIKLQSIDRSHPLQRTSPKLLAPNNEVTVHCQEVISIGATLIVITRIDHQLKKICLIQEAILELELGVRKLRNVTMARAMAVLAVMLMCVVAASAARAAPGRVLAEVPSIAPTPSFAEIPDSPAPAPVFGSAPNSPPEGAPMASALNAPPSWAPVWAPASAPESEGTVGTPTYYGAP